MTHELAEFLIGLDKYVLVDGTLSNSVDIELKFPLEIKFNLSAPDDLDQSMLINIKESSKKSLKMSLHHQYNNSQQGLLRIDYNGRHLNPAEITSSLPQIFVPFAGLWLDDYPGHIHYVVDGYKDLAWAIPLELDTFPVKEVKGRDYYPEVINSFFQRINLRTTVNYLHQMSLL